MPENKIERPAEDEARADAQEIARKLRVREISRPSREDCTQASLDHAGEKVFLQTQKEMDLIEMIELIKRTGIKEKKSMIS